ncbi:hypothetical protein CEV33_3734 [Brucella grignonensis]|uniref:Uncharacterized protein n=1 Tax=Brucella grignonensis TaxID=94627 RepID=A0A256EY33_9HYPH|nr:hypothetical protein CEV33_3734 [Brucella grignonensis]
MTDQSNDPILQWLYPDTPAKKAAGISVDHRELIRQVPR